MMARQGSGEGINGTTTARLERGRSGRGWRVLLGAITGAVVGGFIGGNIANALSCHPYVNFCELGALTGGFYGVLAGAVLGGVSSALIRSPTVVTLWFVLLGASLGASVGIWTDQDRYAMGFVGLCIGAAVGWLLRSNRRGQDSRAAKRP
jgi:hypothetical protein